MALWTVLRPGFCQLLLLGILAGQIGAAQAADSYPPQDSAQPYSPSAPAPYPPQRKHFAGAPLAVPATPTLPPPGQVAADVPQLPPPPVTAAPTTVPSSSLPPPQQLLPAGHAQDIQPGVVYQSAGPVIRRERIHLEPPPSAQVEPPQNFADLSPAAGAEPPGMAPLIPLPANTEPAPPPTIQPLLPPAQVTPQDLRQEAQSLEVILPPEAAPTPITESSAPAPVQVSEPVVPVTDVPAPAITTPAPLIASEPPPSISKESEKILKKIPSNLDRPKPAPSPFNVDRSKDTEYVSKSSAPPQEGETVKQHESMGIKIEVKNKPMNVNYELEKAYSATINGYSEEAIHIYQGILANEPKNTSAMFGLATIYHRAGQIDLARPLYGKILSIEPGNRDALNNFLVLLADEAPQEALSQLENLEDRNPAFSSIPAQMAIIYQRQGDTERATQKMFKAVALAPENLTYRYNLAILLDKQKNFEEATRLYSQLMEAHLRGENIPGDPSKIQERLTFIRSNRH